MSFSSLFFVFTWLPITLFIYYMIPSRFKNGYLVIISLFFYAWGNPAYVLLLIISILLNYIISIGFNRNTHTSRKQNLLFAILVNVCILAYFKYYGFILDSLFAILPFHVDYQLPSMPLGISFFTFSLLSYQIDIYRKKIRPQYNVINFALYVSFFPKLVMGPITSYHEMERQFKSHAVSMKLIDQGAKRFIMGLAQKVILANTFAQIWQYAQNGPTSALTGWLGIIAFTLQIYFDFNGYTNMAIGLANMFGFHLPENFQYPYRALTITDFWRRWHMTLSFWFRDYVYIPLGGNRVSKKKHIANLFLVWLLTGLWHGANFTFILWGLYHGILLILEKYIFMKYRKKLPAYLNWAITILLIMFGWVFFASDTCVDAFHYIGSMFNFTNAIDAATLWYLQSYALYFLLGILVCTPIFHYLYHYMEKKLPQYITIFTTVGIILLFAVSICFMVNDTYTTFLYFNF